MQNAADKLLRAQQLSRFERKDGKSIPVTSPSRKQTKVDKQTVEHAIHDVRFV